MCQADSLLNEPPYNEMTFSHNKGWNLAFCYSMDGTQVHFVRWNKSYRKRQVPLDLSYMWNQKCRFVLQQKKLIDTKNRLVSAGGQGVRWKRNRWTVFVSIFSLNKQVLNYKWLKVKKKVRNIWREKIMEMKTQCFQQ